MSSTPQQAEFTPHKTNVNFINETQRKIAIGIGNSGTSSGQIKSLHRNISYDYAESKHYFTISNNNCCRRHRKFQSYLSMTHGATYYFKVVPNNGAAMSFTKQAPRLLFSILPQLPTEFKDTFLLGDSTLL